MRYYRYRRSSAPRVKFYFSEREIDFTQDYFPYEQFLLQEFFKSDGEMRVKIRNTWISLYGTRSYDIMARKYVDWREGNYHLTKEMTERIVGMMPGLLSDEALKRIGMFEISRAIKGMVKRHLRSRVDRYQRKGKRLTIEEWQRLVIDEYQAIGELKPLAHQYHPLSADDAKATVGIAQFILQLKLAGYEEQVLRDLIAVSHRYEALKRARTEMKYDLRRFAVELDLDGLHQLTIDRSAQELDGRQSKGADEAYQAYADKYFAYELAQVHTDLGKEGASATTFVSDMNLFLEHIEASKAGALETSLVQELKGEGGVLKLRVSVLPPRLAMAAMKKATLMLAASLLGIALYIALMIRFDLVLLLVFSAMFILPWFLPTVVGLSRDIARAYKGL